MKQLTKITLVIPAAALALTACGSDAEPEPPTATETVEVEVPAEPEVVTETVTEEVAPESCLNSTTHADELIEIYSEALSLSADAMNAAAFYDEAGIAIAAEDLEALLPVLEDELMMYYLASEGCKSS